MLIHRKTNQPTNQPTNQSEKLNVEKIMQLNIFLLKLEEKSNFRNRN